MNSQYLYAADALREGRPGISYEQAAPVQRHLRTSPRLLLGPVPRSFGEWHYGDRQAPAVGLYRIDKLMLQADRVLVQDGRILCIEQNGIHPQSIEQADTSRSSERMTDIDQEVVLLCGPAYQMYGHWLIDFLPRLHILTHLGLDLGRLTYLLPHNIMAFSRKWLSLLGIADAQIRTYDAVTETCRIARALIPTAFRGNGRASPLMAAAATAFKTTIIGTPTVTPTRHLLISRRQWGNGSRSMTNADIVEQRMQAAGFEIVCPEELAIDDQIQLFAQARIIVGEYGSGLHNSIFCAGGSFVVNFRGTEGHPGFLQSGLCEALGQDVGYVFCETEIAAGAQRFSAAEQDLALLLPLLADYAPTSGR